MFHPNTSNVGRDALKICIKHDKAVEVTHFMFMPRVPVERPVLFEILRATDTGMMDEEESKPKSEAAPAPPVTPVASVPLRIASPAHQKATEAALLTPITPYALRAGEGASVPASNATPRPSELSSTSKVRKLANPRTRCARVEHPERARLNPFYLIPDINQGISQANHEYLLASIDSLPTSMTESDSKPEEGVQAKKACTE
ncbi:hypothetical protein EWM64_g1245 [Hericium alpestre]|uniref:Uncharacterized protein n=1 Tax=Hericium alpestre TaxID=135208 RepID=A0A4Z0A8V9_9AGAM|nr:hypothetical protein EWM64_g1245 [Hericium alpestre]